MKKLVIGMLLCMFVLPALAVPSAFAAKQAAAADVVSPINLNQATAEELQVLPGVGPALADRIVAYREANGLFTSLEQLVEVKGIGQRKLEKLRDKMTL